MLSIKSCTAETGAWVTYIISSRIVGNIVLKPLPLSSALEASLNKATCSPGFHFWWVLWAGERYEKLWRRTLKSACVFCLRVCFAWQVRGNLPLDQSRGADVGPKTTDSKSRLSDVTGNHTATEGHSQGWGGGSFAPHPLQRLTLPLPGLSCHGVWQCWILDKEWMSLNPGSSNYWDQFPNKT